MAAWQKIKKEYIKGGVTYKQLSDKYGVGLSAIKSRASKEKWTDLRNQTQTKTDQKTVEALSSQNAKIGARLYAITERLLDKLDRAVDELDVTTVASKHKTKVIEYNNQERPDKPTKEIVDEVEEILKVSTIVDRLGARSIASALKDIKEIQSIKGDLDTMEQEARIGKLRREAEKEDDSKQTTVEVVLEGIPEEWIG